MRSETIFRLGLALLACSTTFAGTPLYSCFDLPGVGQTNGLGEGMEDLVEEECCNALINESDNAEDRLVVWDPLNCNHGPDEFPIAEAPLCRAHATDGCRFCHISCDYVAGLCITCDSISTYAPTGAPVEFTSTPTETVITPAPTADISPVTPTPVLSDPPVVEIRTPAPTADLRPTTPSPVLSVPPVVEVSTPSPVSTTLGPVSSAITPSPTAKVTLSPTSIPGFEVDCGACFNMAQADSEALMAQDKTMTCDSTCTTGDEVWGTLNCNYFNLGQNCRSCANTCSEEMVTGVWLDSFGLMCKPCDAI
ncbi:unnamed protein product [Choristocarpus tenellus]